MREKRTEVETCVITNDMNETLDQYGNFKAKEFASKDGAEIVIISKPLINLLSQLRHRIGRPIYINSGYRTPQHNKKVGGARYSYHQYGMAADIRAEGITPEELYNILDEMLGGWGGLELHDTFVHVDVRMNQWRTK